MAPEERMQIAQSVLARSRADGTEVTVTTSQAALTRFTHEAVSQNVDVRDTAIRVRAIVGGRIGIASTNVLDAAAVDDVAARAYDVALFAPPETVAPALAGAAAAHAPAGAYVAATAAATPADRARIAAAVFRNAAENGQWSSGYALTASDGVTIATSNGARLSFDATDAGANVKMNDADSTGFAECHARDVAALDGDALGREASRIARQTRGPIGVDPGDWSVILAPAAAGELLRYVTLHFSAEAYSDGSSFIAGKLGAPVLGSNVTLVDDYAHPLNPGMPFDFEGAPTQRVTLVERGVANYKLTDSTWAIRLNRKNTGHALPAPNSNGPQASHAVLQPGTKPLAQLIGETQRGLLITRTWYVRVVDQRAVRVTGMTRDGTFLIQDGHVRGGVRNMRFNESLIAALRDCEIADTPVRTGSYHYSLVTPAIKFNHFHFASASPY